MKRAGFVSLLVVLAAAAACAVASAESGPSRNGVVRVGDPDEVKGPVTTGGTVAMRNLESDLLDAEERVVEAPTSIHAQLRRSNLVYLRARVTGDIDEMARALTMTDACVRENRSSAEARLLRAVQLQTLHRFDDARADLRIARKLGGDPQKIAVLERELDWNAGLAGPAAKAIREEAASQPTVASLTRAARLARDLRQHDAADALYGSALARVESKDPIPVAMLEVQRGTNLADAGRLVEAAETFRNAAARLPMYTAAREHLAKTLHRLGHDDQACALYEEITRSSSDPEFVGALAALYRHQGRIAEADQLRARATKRYEELIGRYPEAMAFHAAEFFAGEGGDATRAWQLLQQNVAIRPNAESLEALGRVERAAGDKERADHLMSRAGAIRAAAQNL